jgi:ubiquinone/menaquinone biosynthesis C-methylase UbiE
MEKRPLTVRGQRVIRVPTTGDNEGFEEDLGWIAMALGGPSVPFVPTRPEVLDLVFQALDLKEGDVLYDLGCGDGRIVVEAAKRYPVKKAVGVELRDELYKEATERVKREGLDSRVEIIHGDFFRVPISEATVVYMYLLTSVNEALKPKLKQELKPGTRVVTLDFQIPGWKPVKVIGDRGGWQRTLYVYVIGDSDV